MSELVDTTSTNEEEKEVAVGSEQLQEGEEKGDDNKKNADYESSDGASASGGENFDENDSIDSITEAVETPDEANNNSKGDMTAESAVTEDENTQEDQKNEVNALPEPVIDGVNFVEVFFGEGSLGVTLRRRANDGIVYVHEILPNSQATELDIEPADQLWRVGDVEVRDNPLDKDSWLNLIHYIKDCPRPMRSVWRRPPPVPESERADIAQDTTPMKSDGCTSGRNSPLKPQDEPISPTGVSSKADVSAEKDLPKQKTEYTVDPLLESTMAKLDFKDRNPKVRKLDSEMYKKYLVPGRRVVKTGVVGIATKASIWSSQAKRVLILLSDLLIISIPSSNDRKTVESIIELPICKINSDGHSFGGGADGVISGDTEFELIWPGGTIRIAADSHETKEVWVLSIFVAICDCVGQDEKVLGWRHQYMLGTMHAAVLSRDEFRVHELISLCESEKLDFSLIESRDMDGYTPLHYACMFRLHPIVLSLQEATADVTSTDVNGLTPLHWAALQLDDYVLSLLLTHVFDADITDEFGRTPLYMAVVEGRDVTGKTDSDELLNCVRCLHERKPNADIRDRRGNTLLHYLAGSWQFNCMEILIEDGANISAVEKETGMTALHRAISGRPLKRAIGEGSIILREGTAYDRKNDFPYVYDNVWKKSTPVEMEELNRPYGAETIKTLLRAGAAPNKKDGRGRTPLAIIAQEDTIDIWDFDLSEAVAALLSFGARLDDSPAISSLKSKCFDINFAALQEKWISTPPVNGDALGIKFNHFMEVPELRNTIYVGEENLDISSGRSVSPTSNSANGSCLLCGFQFTMFKRQHHCRICNILCCDECSKKRCLIENAPVRACDCCFNRLVYVQEKENQKEMLQEPKATGLAAKLDILESTSGKNQQSSEAQKRMTLFGGAKMEDNNSKTTGKVQANTDSTMATMNETRQRLEERGEKLSRATERSAEMANQASEFAKLAKKLNEQQKSRWF